MQGNTFVFFGIGGAGKGTQIKLLIDFLETKDGNECVYAGTGRGFRKLVSSGSYTGTLVKEFIDQGKLVPDFLTNALFTDVLLSKLTPEKHLISDGYPRTIEQSESFEKMMSFFKRDNVKIVYIELNEVEAMKRNLLRGRPDDTEVGLKKRFEEYANNVVPAVSYFKHKTGYSIFTINGEQTPEEVFKDILKGLEL